MPVAGSLARSSRLDEFARESAHTPGYHSLDCLGRFEDPADSQLSDFRNGGGRTGL